MRKTTAILTLATMLVFCGRSLSQWQDPAPQSPEAAALSKALNYPVSYNTGIPNISIPLFSLKTGQLTLPFSLNYHSGGFKVNETEGSVGLGWSLSPMLQITRSVRGGDDLINNGNAHEDGYAYNEYCKGSTGANELYSGASAMDSQLRLYNSWKRDHDQEPDQFNYSLLGKSGSFFFRKDIGGNLFIVPSPYNGVKIELVSGGFKITDTDGTVYYFDGATEKSGAPTPHAAYWNDYPVTAWKCRQVVSPNKVDTIDFHYSDRASTYAYSFSSNAEIYETSCSNSTHFYPGNIAPSHTDYDQVKNFYIAGTGIREPNPRYVINSDGTESGVYTPYVTQKSQIQLPQRHTPRSILTKAQMEVSVLPR